MTHHLLDEHETRGLLVRHEVALQGAIVRGVERWQSMPPALSVSYGPVSRAAAVHDLVCEAARAQFLGCDGVTVRQEAGTTFLVFAGRLAVRFKKVDGDHLRYSLSPTHRQQAIHTQQLALEGTDARFTWATAGYQLDEADRLARTVLVVREGDRLRFAFDIAGDAPAAPVALPLAYDDDGLDIRPSARDGEQTGTGAAP